jgi:hypothetical protein
MLVTGNNNWSGYNSWLGTVGSVRTYPLAMFVIEDEAHGEPVGEFGRRAEAIAELRRLAAIPWNEAPNVCPCSSWRTCARYYHLVEYDTRSTPWQQISNVPALKVSATATSWLLDTEE